MTDGTPNLTWSPTACVHRSPFLARMSYTPTNSDWQWRIVLPAHYAPRCMTFERLLRSPVDAG